MPSLAEILGVMPRAGGGVLQNISQGRMPPAIQDQAVDPSWYRPDGSRKGMGFLGPLPHKMGGTSTELSIGVDVGGKPMEIPSLVPTLSKDEIDHLLSGAEPTDAIVQKAVEHAIMRMKAGQSVFAD